MESTCDTRNWPQMRQFALDARVRSRYPVSATADWRELPAGCHLLYNSAGYSMRVTTIFTTATSTTITTTQPQLRTG
jgi:hypothetical protein